MLGWALHKQTSGASDLSSQYSQEYLEIEWRYKDKSQVKEVSSLKNRGSLGSIGSTSEARELVIPTPTPSNHWSRATGHGKKIVNFQRLNASVSKVVPVA
jgi:hypothetical protein